ncbi:MAG TPA: dual specificity protein phosphatase family protein [Candidatus Polarisedimenticolia bacterium]|nr:dual specificity protein phosphatase family protein [Candidatus Polarisedimenticolia bacterium]
MNVGHDGDGKATGGDAMAVELFQADDAGFLFFSPALTEWAPLEARGIDTVIDLEGGLDQCIPNVHNHILYIYFPIFDEELPNLDKLNAVADMAAGLIRSGHRVLSHCGMGYNRSALVAGLILVRLGVPGTDAVTRLRSCRPGVLFNEVFASHLESLGSSH